jgi:catechol 2,3-dioxygenase-like lactoylglutathione lyase family enzyme
MIAGVGSVAILVRVAKKSAEWYRDKLGFEIVGIEGHGAFVKPKHSTQLIHLCGPCDAWETGQPGARTGVWFQCGAITIRKEKNGQVLPASNAEDVERTYFELKEKGVEFSGELTTTNWGKYAILKDLDGNEFEIS